MSSALASKTETTKMYKRKLSIAMEVLNKVSVESPETKEFIDQKLQQKYFRGNISIEEVTFSLTSQSNIFYCAVLVFN